MKHTGGKWDPHAKNVYFIASNVESLKEGEKSHTHLLCAVNEINTDEDMRHLCEWADKGKPVFIDSGVFSLTNKHARAHNMKMDEVLVLAPDKIDGFDELFSKYCKIIDKIGDACWGYIEIDQGGRENKIKTRAKLEGMGYRPIPVYHPFGDGWEYFDELAQNYDRICFGNVVQADRETRKRLLATAWERRRKYPNLWIHLLGLTTNEQCNAFPVDSCDSSTWLSLVRWPDAFKARTGGQPFSAIERNITYESGSDPYSEKGHRKARQLGGYHAHFTMRNWQTAMKDYSESLEADPNGYTT